MERARGAAPRRALAAACLVRHQGPDNTYMVRLSSGYGHVELWKTHGGVVQVKPFAFQPGQAYRVSVIASGRWIAVAVNGAELFRYAGPVRPLRHGRVGFGVRESRARFADVRVEPVAHRAAPVPEHRPDFRLRKWVGRDYLFDGDEPVGFVFDDPGSALILNEVKLAPGLMPLLIAAAGIRIQRLTTELSRANRQVPASIHKGDGLKLLKNDFAACCRRHGGVVRHWAGDGGFAFFLSTNKVGRAVKAAEAFIENIPHLNAATAIRLGAQSFGWEFRICAHRGEVLLSASVGIESADPENLDDFLKYAKRFAPVTDEFFITQRLYAAVAARVKKRFELFKASVTAGALHCGLYRLKRAPVAHADDILKHGDEVSEISPQEWSYLRATIRADRENVAARNLITKGLIQSLDSPPARRTEADICEKRLLQLTVTALYNYLHAAFRKNRFSVCYWRLSEVAGKTYLKKAFCRYAEGVLPGGHGRRVRVDRQEFQICRAYQTRTPIATASVVGARLAGAWIDFDGGQKRSKRGLVSALQVPVYYVDAGNDRHCVGVLSLDSNRPDTFMPEELVHWQDDLVGFLVNIALAERIREVREGRSKGIRRLRR